MSDEPVTQEDPALEPAPEVTPSPVEINQQMALESLSEGEELVECPTCHNQRRAFLIDANGECDSDRALREQAVFPAVELGWPEVRQRRNLLLTDTDSTQVEDYPAAKKTAMRTIRQSLRDVTQLPDPLAAYRKLDELQRDIQLNR